MEQASGSFMTGIRAFSAHLPLVSFVALYCSSRLRLQYLQVNNGVFLDCVEDIYTRVLFVLVSI